jgi:radical SAM superfamily enzyme YgiQ (UPF0313 family)
MGKRMKIAFIEPRPPVNLYFFLGKFPLLGPLFLGTMLKNEGHEVRVFKEDITPVYSDNTDWLHPFLKEADIVGLTSVTHTAKRAYQIADEIKMRFPDKKVILGGSHVSALPEEALQHADQVVVGEGENVALDVFNGTIREKIVQGSQVHIDEVPPLDLELLQGFRNRRGKIGMVTAPIMASRGCPFDCIFCSVTQMFGREYRIRDADLVMDEVMMRYNEGFRSLFFYDDNFAANPGKTKIFLEKLIRADLKITWSSQFSIHVAKDKELVRMLKRSNCTTLYIGVESINPEALKDYNKSQSVSMIRESIRSLSSAGFHVHSMFVLGADSDNEETIDNTIRFSRESGSSTAQFSILFPIPGTHLYDQVKEKNQIFINDWNYYDGTHSVILRRSISPLKLQKKMIHAYRYFYRQKLTYRLISRIGFFIWKLKNGKYLKYIRYVTRKLRRRGVVEDGILTFKGLLSDSLPGSLSLALRMKKELLSREM